MQIINPIEPTQQLDISNPKEIGVVSWYAQFSNHNGVGTGSITSEAIQKGKQLSNAWKYPSLETIFNISFYDVCSAINKKLIIPRFPENKIGFKLIFFQENNTKGLIFWNVCYIHSSKTK